MKGGGEDVGEETIKGRTREKQNKEKLRANHQRLRPRFLRRLQRASLTRKTRRLRSDVQENHIGHHLPAIGRTAL